MYQVKWIKFKDQLPQEGKTVWIGHYRTNACQLGYYRQLGNAVYDIAGNGIAASHWAEVVKPQPPTALDL